MPTLAAVLAALLVPASMTERPDWAGKWWTTRGLLELRVSGDDLTGTYGQDGRNTVEGEFDGRTARATWREGARTGTVEWTLDADRAFFDGTWQHGNDRGTWVGWRDSEDATRGKRAKFDGLWRTSLGVLDLTQKGGEAEGLLGAQGWYEVDGEVAGRRLELRYDSPFGPGTLWAIQRGSGDAAYGAGTSADGSEWRFVLQRLEDHPRDWKPAPGKIVGGLTKNRLTFHLHVPKGFTRRKGAPAIVFLHGSNMSSRPYVETLAQRHGDRFAVIGIDGERWVDTSEPDDPRHNYTYVNWMGRSTYRGYPNTDRESPALVAEAIEELRETLNLSKVLVGGHSQGGYLSYFFLMHFPELVDGVFPVAAGLVIQCEPDVFENDDLREAQRATPLAIVHGRQDGAVAFAQGEGAFRSFQEHGFAGLRLFDNDAGHAFVALRIDEAIAWLDALSSDAPAELLEFAERSLAAERYRDASAALQRLRRLDLDRDAEARADDLAERLDAAAAPDAATWLEILTSDPGDGSWIDAFLDYRDRFELVAAAGPAMAAFAKLRAEHEEPAKALFAEARRAFQQGDHDAGYAKYRELVTRRYASSLYRRVRGWLDAAGR